MSEGTSELSDREVEILKLVATGASNKEIAQQLIISSNTVKVHLRNIFNKIEVSSRTEAALYAVRAGLVEGQVLPEAETNQNGSVALETTSPPSIVEQPARTLRLGLAAGAVMFLSVALVLIFYSSQPPNAGLTSDFQGPTPSPRWQQIAPLAVPRRGLAAAAYGAQIYAIGGESAEGVSGFVEKFESANNAWEPAAEKLTPVADIHAAVLGGLIYIPGGRTSSGEPTDILEVFDPLENRWERRGRLPIRVSAYALAVFDGQIYLFGGWDGQHYLDTVWSYDPGLDEWSRRTNLPTSRAFAGAAVSGREIFVLGGYNGQDALNVNEIYQPDRDDGTADPWSVGAEMPDRRYGLSATSVADIVHVMGGKATETGEPGSFLAYEYFPNRDEWEELDSPFTDAWSDFGLAPLSTHLYLIGGRHEADISAQSYSYQAIYTILFPGVP